MFRLILTALCLVLPAASLAAQTVDEIVAKALASRGGEEKLRSIQTVKSVVKRPGPDGKDLTTTTWFKRPNKMRSDTEIPNRTVTVATDGKQVWTMDSATGVPQQVQGPQAQGAREQATLFDPPLLDYKQRGERIELAEPATIGGVQAHHLRLTRKSGRITHHYISIEDGRALRIVETFEQGDLKEEIQTDFSDFQTVEGMFIPFTITQSMRGKPVVTAKVEKMEFNVAIEDEFFQMPGK